MRALAVGVWKEWRDHRAVLLGVFGALAFLTCLGFAAFGERLGGARTETLALIFLGVGAVLVTLAVVADLWAGETRRGTLAVLQRLPGGLRRALIAKGVFLLLTWIAMVLFQGLTLGLALELGAPPPAADLHWAQFRTLGSIWWALAGLLLVPAPFVWAVSTWLGRSGAALMGALVVLAALALPFYLLLEAHPWSLWLFAEDPGDALRLSAIVVGAALLAVVLSVLRGHRFAARPLRPAAWGLGVLGVSLCAGFAYAQARVEAYLTFGPDVEGFTILQAHVGAGERYLYLDVAKAAPAARAAGTRQGDRRTTPPQTWVVDLHDASTLRLGGASEATYFNRVPDAWSAMSWSSDTRPLAPAEALVLYEGTEDGISSVRWIDARRAEVKRVLPSQTADAVSDELTRRELMASTWIRDEQGRRIWSREGRVEREGDAWVPPERVRRRDPFHTRLTPAPSGWIAWTPRPTGHVQRPLEFRELDGTTTVWALQPSAYYSMHQVLSRDFGYQDRRERVKEGPKRWGLRRTRVVLPLPALEPAIEVQDSPDETYERVEENTLLAGTGAQGQRRLEFWNPVSGEAREVSFEGEDPGPVQHVSVRGRASDGSLLLLLTREDAGTRYAAWAQLRSDLSSARLLTPMQPGWGWREFELAFLPDGTLYVLKGNSEILRFGITSSGQRTVERVYPR